MYSSDTKSRAVQKKRLQSDELNVNMLFIKKALGRVVHYDEKSYLNELQMGSVRYILRKLLLLIQDEVRRYEEIDKIKSFYRGNTPSRILESMIDNPDVWKFVNRNVLERRMTISEAYRRALDNQFRQFQDQKVTQHGKKKAIQVAEYVKLMDRRVYSMTQYLLLDRLQKSIKQDFILVIDRFIPEVFFQPSDYLKGIIYRNKYKQETFNHFAIHYQLPIMMSQNEFYEDQMIIMDIENQSVIINPTELDLGKLTDYFGETLSKCYIVNPYSDTNYKVHGMISNYKDVKLIKHNCLMQSSLLYHTDVVVTAKGAPLTEEEWSLRFEHIIKHFKGDELIVRLPGFNRFMNVDEVENEKASLDMLATYPDMFEPLTRALSKAIKPYPQIHLTISVPHVEYQMDYETWKFHMCDAIQMHEVSNEISVAFECDTERSMYEIDDLKQVDSIVMNLDGLCEDYINEYIFSRDHVVIEDIRKCNLYADFQYTKEFYKYKAIVPRCILQGHVLQQESVFKRLVIAGYREFIIPVQSVLDYVSIIDKRAHDRGNYAGVYHEDRERTLFYRELKKRSNLPPGSKRPYGLYKKVKDHKKKKEEEKKNNKDDNEDSNEEK